MLQRFYDLRIMNKLILVSVLALAVFLIGNLYVSARLGSLGKELNSISEYDLKLSHVVSTIAIHQLEQVVAFERGVSRTAENPQNLDQSAAEFRRFEAEIKKEIVAGERLAEEGMQHAFSDFEREKLTGVLKSLKQVKADYESYLEHVEEYQDVAARGDSREALALLRDIEREQSALDETLTGMSSELSQLSQETLAVAGSHEQAIIVSLLVSFLVAAAVSLGLFFLLGRKISNSLESAVASANQMAKENFDVELSSSAKDEVSIIVSALDQMTEIMRSSGVITERVTRALDVCDTNVMVADAGFNIVYMNDSVQKMMRDNEK